MLSCIENRKASERIQAYESIARLESADNLKLTEMYSFLIESRRKVLQVELDFEGIRKRRKGV